MIRLPTVAVTALRDRLRERGARPSISLPLANASPDELLDRLIAEEYAPLCDAMFLMMAADQQLTAAERDVIRGAMRELDDRIRSRHVETMLATSAEALAREGWLRRLEALGEAIGDDPPRAEAAILLAAAVAYADGVIAKEENDVMARLMLAVGVSEARMLQLVGSLEQVDMVLERDAKADAADVLVHASLRLRTPEDFERLAATTDRPDLTHALRLYAHYVRACDDLHDRSVHPRSLPTACVAALRELASGLIEGRSDPLDALRARLAELAGALARIDSTPSLRALADGDALGALEGALDRIGALTYGALGQQGAAISPTPLPRALRRAAEGVVRQEQAARASLGMAIDAVSAWGGPRIPSAVLATARLVLARVGEAEVDAASPPAEAPALAALPDWIPKSRVLGGFLVQRTLGEGGAGSVFVATRLDERDDPDAPHYALKVPHYDAVAARSLSEAEYLRVFKLEAGALLALPEHPNLAGFVTFDARARPKPLLVMELVEGQDCLTLLKRGELGCAKVLGILEGVLEGLGAMHEAGVGHLDVKPGNIVLRPGGEPVLVDFGLAGRHVRVGCATPGYASPEVWGHKEDGVEPPPFAADVYSLACVAYELLTGMVLFEEEHVLALMSAHFEHDGHPPKVRAMAANARLASVAAWLVPALRRDPKARPNAYELRASLRALAPILGQARWPLA